MAIPNNTELWTQEICRQNMYSCFAALREMNKSAVSAINTKNYRTAFNKLVDMTAGATAMHNTGLTELRQFVADNAYAAAQIALGGQFADEEDRKSLALAGLKDARSNVLPSEGDRMTWYIHQIEDGGNPDKISEEMSPHFPFEVLSTLNKNDDRLRDVEGVYRQRQAENERGGGGKLVPVIIILILLGIVGGILVPKMAGGKNKSKSRDHSYADSYEEAAPEDATEPEATEPEETAAPVSHDDLVTIAFHGDNGEGVDLYYPRINLDSEDAQAANREIEEKFSGYMGDRFIVQLDYIYYITDDDLLSVAVYEKMTGGGFTDYTPYTFDLKTGKRLSDSELLERFNTSGDAVVSALRNTEEAYFESQQMTPAYFNIAKEDYLFYDEIEGYHYSDYRADFYYSTMDDKNLEKYRLFVGTKGLLAIVNEYSPGSVLSYLVVDVPGERRFRYFEDLLNGYCYLV